MQSRKAPCVVPFSFNRSEVGTSGLFARSYAFCDNKLRLMIFYYVVRTNLLARSLKNTLAFMVIKFFKSLSGKWCKFLVYCD